MRRWLQNLSLTLMTIVLFFTGGEAALRVTGVDRGQPKTPPIYQKSDDPRLSYELKPNIRETAFRSTVTTNALGLRSAEPDPSKKTIAILGDSVAFGYGLEDDETMGSRLDHSFNRQYNVMTVAAPGYTLEQTATLHQDVTPSLNPATVILIFNWNDLNFTEPAVLDDEGNLHEPGWTPETRKCHPIENGILGWIPGRCWLDQHSAVYRTIKKFVSLRQEKRNAAEQVESMRESAFGDWVTQEQLHRYGQQLQAFNKNIASATPKLFVIWPERQLHLQTEKQLTAFAQSAGFRVLNLYEVFGNKPASLWWDTSHPNAQTIEEAASVITAALQEWKMLPR